MNWNMDRSLRLSRACVYLFMALYAVICISAPWLVRLLIDLRGSELAPHYALFLISIYACAVPAALALRDLHILLRNIARGEVFVQQNIAVLRGLSWYCIAAGLICAASSLYYMPFLLIAVAGAFIGLILRVVKNVFAEAVKIKQENDFTI